MNTSNTTYSVSAALPIPNIRFRLRLTIRPNIRPKLVFGRPLDIVKLLVSLAEEDVEGSVEGSNDSKKKIILLVLGEGRTSVKGQSSMQMCDTTGCQRGAIPQGVVGQTYGTPIPFQTKKW